MTEAIDTIFSSVTVDGNVLLAGLRLAAVIAVATIVLRILQLLAALVQAVLFSPVRKHDVVELRDAKQYKVTSRGLRGVILEGSTETRLKTIPIVTWASMEKTIVIQKPRGGR